MKMNYLLKSSNFEDRKKSARKRVLIIAVILIITVLILATGPVRRLLFSIAEPLWKSENVISNSNFLKSLHSICFSIFLELIYHNLFPALKQMLAEDASGNNIRNFLELDK